MYARLSGCTLLSFVQMYIATSDVRCCLWCRRTGGTTRCTLIESTPYSMNSTQTYAQKCMNVCYFLEYPLGNTWAYEIAFGPLCNSTGCTLGLGERPLLFRELVATLPYIYPYPELILLPLYAPRLPVDPFVSIL
jgi:hypothetical protein